MSGTLSPRSGHFLVAPVPAMADHDKDGWLMCQPAGHLDVVHVGERHLAVQRHMVASPSSVWALIADFPNLATHWPGLRGTRAVGHQRSGVGARRLVELRPIGSMEETVTAWEDGRRLATENHPSPTLPFNRAAATLTLAPEDGGTVATFEYRYVPRGGPLGRFTGPLIDRMLTRTFSQMLTAIEQAAVAKDAGR